MDALQAIHGRRAVRNYADKAVGDEVIGGLIDAAVWAPSGMDLQPWCFFLVDDPATLAACAAQAKTLALAQSAERPELSSLREMLASPTFNIFYNAPALMIICATTEDEMALKDCCLAAQNFMLAAHAQGLGTCWIGFSEAWLNTVEAKAKLGIPPGFKPVAPVIVGYPKGSTHSPKRRAPDIRRVNVVGKP